MKEKMTTEEVEKELREGFNKEVAELKERMPTGIKDALTQVLKIHEEVLLSFFVAGAKFGVEKAQKMLNDVMK